MHQRVAILVQRTHPKSGKKRWALVSRKKVKGKRRVLRWFKGKPSTERVKKEEARVQFFKRKGSLAAWCRARTGSYFASHKVLRRLTPVIDDVLLTKVAMKFGKDHKAVTAIFDKLRQAHREGRLSDHDMTLTRSMIRYLQRHQHLTNRQIDYLENLHHNAARRPLGKPPKEDFPSLDADVSEPKPKKPPKGKKKPEPPKPKGKKKPEPPKPKGKKKPEPPKPKGKKKPEPPKPKGKKEPPKGKQEKGEDPYGGTGWTPEEPDLTEFGEDDEDETPRKKKEPAPKKENLDPALHEHLLEFGESDDDEDEDEAPRKPKKKEPAPVDPDLMEFGEDDDEAPRKPKKKEPAPVDPDLMEFGEDDDEAPRKPKKKDKKKPRVEPLDMTEFGGDEDDAPPRKHKDHKKPKVQPVVKPKVKVKVPKPPKPEPKRPDKGKARGQGVAPPGTAEWFRAVRNKDKKIVWVNRKRFMAHPGKYSIMKKYVPRSISHPGVPRKPDKHKAKKVKTITWAKPKRR
jgi:hypothetical protein